MSSSVRARNESRRRSPEGPKEAAPHRGPDRSVQACIEHDFAAARRCLPSRARAREWVSSVACAPYRPGALRRVSTFPRQPANADAQGPRPHQLTALRKFPRRAKVVHCIGDPSTSRHPSPPDARPRHARQGSAQHLGYRCGIVRSEKRHTHDASVATQWRWPRADERLPTARISCESGAGGAWLLSCQWLREQPGACGGGAHAH